MSHQSLTVISVAYIKITIIVAIFLNLSFNQCIYNVLRNYSNLFLYYWHNTLIKEHKMHKYKCFVNT